MEDRELATTIELEAGKQILLGPMVVEPVGRIQGKLDIVSEALDAESLCVELREIEQDAEQGDWMALGGDHIRTVEGILHLERVPTGAWNVRVGAENYCNDDAGWFNREPIKVRTGETVHVMLAYREGPPFREGNSTSVK